MNPLPVVRASILRNPFTVLLFTGLIALAVALGIAISVQERALRQGSARAADKFDLIVAAPGSQTDLLLSAVFLRPSAVELLSPALVEQVLTDPDARFAAPIGFGDSYRDSPVVGTIAPFVEHLSGGLGEGRLFAAEEEAVIGALVDAPIGASLEIRHGNADEIGDADGYAAEDHDHEGDHDHAHDDGHAHDDHAHEDDHAHADGHDHAHDGHDPEDEHGHDHAGGDPHVHGSVTVVGRMQPTGTPWDNAVIVPVEYVWSSHGMGTGHAPGDTHIGAPFAPGHVPGLPVVVMKPENVSAAYGLRARYRTEGSTAFFPAEALLDLYEVMGGAVRIMSLLTLAAQVLVVAAILAGLLAVLDLQRRRFAMLRALGAPSGFVFLSVWLYVGVMVVIGALAGLILGWGLSAVVSGIIGRMTGVALTASLGWREISAVATLVLVALCLALLPAFRIYRMSAVDGLR